MIYKPEKSIWFNPNIEYLFDKEIYEYDLEDAGFNIIKQYNLLPQNEIERLSKIEKGFKRHKEIGIMQRDKNLSDALSNKFTEVRRMFIEANNIKDYNLISVKKDAFFIIGSVRKLKFDKLKFNTKNSYSSYIRFTNIQNIEIYYGNNGIDVKGIRESSLNKHRIYILEFIINTIKGIENNSSSVKRKLISFIDKYKQGDLDEEYYLEFNNKSKEINPLFNYQNIIIPLTNIILREVV